MHAFTLKARPEPPLVSTPAAKGKVRTAEVEFKWSENAEAGTYHLQVARDAAFRDIAFEDKACMAWFNLQNLSNKLKKIY